MVLLVYVTSEIISDKLVLLLSINIFLVHLTFLGEENSSLCYQEHVEKQRLPRLALLACISTVGRKLFGWSLSAIFLLVVRLLSCLHSQTFAETLSLCEASAL